jgi:hypothetical protein
MEFFSERRNKAFFYLLQLGEEFFLRGRIKNQKDFLIYIQILL